MNYVVMLDQIDTEKKHLYGDKASNLALVKRLGLPVPEGFAIDSRFCREYLKNKVLLDVAWEAIISHLRIIEKRTGKKFGASENPLLLSVRASPIIVMPGILSTVLNVGINDKIAETLAKNHGTRFALETYLKFIVGFGSTFSPHVASRFKHIISEALTAKGANNLQSLDISEVKSLITKLKREFKRMTGESIPDDPYEQLRVSIAKVIESWNNPKSREYRRRRGISDEPNLAVLIMEMKFGNLDDKSAAGVLFTRNPNTGEKKLIAEFQIKTQGDEIVSGEANPIRTLELSRIFPDIYQQLEAYAELLERTFMDALDIEFTIESGKLWLLQVRSLEKTPESMIKIFVSMYKEGILDDKTLLEKIDHKLIRHIFYPRIDAKSKKQAIDEGRYFYCGVGASPGVGIGPIKFVSVLDTITEESVAGRILIFRELRPPIVQRVRSCEGIIVLRGGSTSHAIIIARAIGKPVVILHESEKILCDFEKKLLSNNIITLKEGDIITIDGFSGDIFIGKLKKVYPSLPREFYDLLTIAEKHLGSLEVRANVESPNEASEATYWNIKNINVRTEIRDIIYAYVIAEDKDEKNKVLTRLKSIQKKFFYNFVVGFKGETITFKLIDPPFHEFLPEIIELIKKDYYNRYYLKIEDEALRRLIKRILEIRNRNPMLGLRGIRIGILHPEIYLFQVKALLDALFEAGKVENSFPQVRLLLPNIINAEEVRFMRRLIDDLVDRYNRENSTNYRIPIGVVVETPAALINLNEIVDHIDFIVIGSNDLTQLVLGMGRDDSEKFFLSKYLELNILERNPFISLAKPVIKLLKLGLDMARKRNPNMEIGLAGEHANDFDSIRTCIKLGLDYISVNIKLAPIAKIMASKANILESDSEEKKAHFRSF